MKRIFSRWSAQDLVVIGVFAAASKVTTLLVALAGGGMNPISLMGKNLVFTMLLVVMLCRVNRPGTLLLFTVINMIVSMLLLGASVTLLPPLLLSAFAAELAMLAMHDSTSVKAKVLGAAVFDIVSKVGSLGLSSIIGTETETHAGGIAAKISSGTIENCACYANIEAFCYVGGIVGEVVATGTKVVNIKNCLFKGSLTVRKPNGSGYGCGGGIVGCIGNGTNPGEANVTNCVALVDAITCGAQMSFPSVGGLAGYVKKSVFDNCYTNLAVANISMVSGSGNQYGSLYGVTWWAYSPVIKNCYYLANNRIGRDGGTVALENVSGLTIEEMTNGTLLNKLKAVGGDWTANSDGYPVPSGVFPLQ